MNQASTPTTPTAGTQTTLSGRTARRSRLDGRTIKWVIRAVVFAAVIGTWELLARPMNRALFAPPSEVLAAAVRLTTTEPSIWGPLRDSLFAMLVGLSGGLLLGIPLGLIMGRSKRIHFVLDPYVTFLYVIPSVAFVPLLILWLGFNQSFQIALVFESTLFPIMINSAAGAQNVEQDLVDGGRAFRASQWQIMRTIIIPASLPFVFAGVRIAFSAAWVGVVVAQMTGALSGLGGMILRAASTFRTADMLVPIFVIMAVGVIIHGLTSSLQHRLTPWHRPEGNGGA